MALYGGLWTETWVCEEVENECGAVLPAMVEKEGETHHHQDPHLVSSYSSLCISYLILHSKVLM